MTPAAVRMLFDMGLCWNRWKPRTCNAPKFQRAPLDHCCMQPRNIPHICFCWRCYVRAERKRTTP